MSKNKLPERAGNFPEFKQGFPEFKSGSQFVEFGNMNTLGFGGSGFIAEFKAVLAATTVPMVNSEKVIFNKMMTRFKNVGLLEAAEIIDIFFTTDQGNSLINWANPGTFTPVAVASPTFAANSGYTGDSGATKKYLKLSFIPSTQAQKVTKDDMCIMVGIGSHVSESLYEVGCASAAADTLIGIRNVGGNFQYGTNFNDKTGNSAGAFIAYLKNISAHYCLNRISSSQYEKYINHWKVTTVNVNSTQLPAIEMYACGIQSYTAPSPTNKNQKYIIISKSLTQSQIIETTNAIEEALTSLNANNIISINNICDRVIGYNTFKITAAGDYLNIDVLKTYSWLVTRDFVMSVDNYKAGFSAEFLLNSYNIIKYKTTTTGELAYQIPDGITLDTLTVANYYADRAAVDGNLYFIQLAYLYYEKTGSTSFISSEIDFLNTLLENVTAGANGLPWSDTFASGNRKVTWGFFDGVYISGESLFCSCLQYKAYQYMAIMANAISNTVIYDACVIKIAAIKAAIKAQFYVEDIPNNKYWMRASNGACSGQFDLPGTCLAIYYGIIDGQDAINIATYINSIIDECILEGGVIWVPFSHQYNPGVTCWESGGSTYGRYQSGGYWSTALPWLIYTLNLVNTSKAQEILRDSWAYNLKYNAPEWWTSGDVNSNVLLYATSQTALSLSNSLLGNILT
jgi:hypothetical protein